MRYLISSALVFSSFAFSNHSSPSESDHQIRWSADAELGMNDFQGAVPNLTSWSAATYSVINLTYMDYNGHLRDIDVYAFFDQKQSWMKDKSQTILHHEQLHFDITEIYSRQLFAKLSLLSSQKILSRNEVSKLFTQINDACGEMQDAYDHATRHGIDAEQQNLWSEKIKGWLKDQYSTASE